MVLAGFTPGGVTPSVVKDANVTLPGTMVRGIDGRLLYQPEPSRAGLYVLGHDRSLWIDGFGLLALLCTTLAVLTHALLRVRAARRRLKENQA
jgi:hypothetical protein